MRAERTLRSWAALGLALLLLAAPASPIQAQPEGSPWRLEASDGACTGLYSLDGRSAQGFSWSPTGDLIWLVLQRGGPADDLRLRVDTAAGESFSGLAAPDDDKDLRSYTLVSSDRRNARLILSGDIAFSYQLGGRRIEQVVPAGLQAPRIMACMSQARQQVERGEVASPAPSSRDQGGEPRVVATGSGVFVDSRGSLITNAHVIEGCSAVGSRILGAGKVLAVDEASDLALLRFERPAGAPFARLRESGVRLGEPVVAAGFPLQNVLSNGLNITTGNVSALAGVQGDRRMIQITAPVQPGNSGGALLDANGRLIGIVVARLTDKAAPAPQNINFAVAPFVVGAFLRENDVVIAPASAAPVGDVAAAARQFTAYLECVG
ncbi:MAG: serine protease [Phenylobacterium sp.]